jgi:hypothetical protein
MEINGRRDPRLTVLCFTQAALGVILLGILLFGTNGLVEVEERQPEFEGGIGESGSPRQIEMIINEIRIGVKREYAEKLLGIPKVSIPADDAPYINAFYKLPGIIVRCVYHTDYEEICGYMLTLTNQQPLSQKVLEKYTNGKKLGEATYAQCNAME